MMNDKRKKMNMVKQTGRQGEIVAEDGGTQGG